MPYRARQVRIKRPKKQKPPRTNDSFYKTKAWKQTSKAVLDRDEVCVECDRMGLVVAAWAADHIVPLCLCREQGIDPYDMANLQGLCAKCHSLKTSKEKSGRTVRE